METAVAAKKNCRVKVAVPKAGNERLKFIFARGYPWATGTTTERIVSADDAAALEAETRAAIKDPVTGKTTTMQRFTCIVAGESEMEAAKKNPHIGPAKLTFTPNPVLEQTKALKDGIGQLVTMMADLIAVNRAQAIKAR